MLENVPILADLHIKLTKNANLTKKYLRKFKTGIEKRGIYAYFKFKFK
jgi:hypothetical protein